MKISYWRNKADRALQEKVVSKNPRCFICPNRTQVSHHFFPKSVSSALRYDLENNIPLCNGCHMRLHQSGDPSYEQRIIAKKGQKWFDDLEKRKRDYVKVNINYFQQKLKELQ